MRATSPARAPSPSELARQSDGGANVLAFTRTSRVPARMVLVLLGNDNRAAMMSVPLGKGSPGPDGDRSIYDKLMAAVMDARAQRGVLNMNP